jgi:transcription elongation factor Elf1
MTNKNRTKQLQMNAALSHKRAMKKYKGPYDCPKCFEPEKVNLIKLDKNDKTIQWLIMCNNCRFCKKIELPVLLGQIDVYNRVSDILRSEQQ